MSEVQTPLKERTPYEIWNKCTLKEIFGAEETEDENIKITYTSGQWYFSECAFLASMLILVKRTFLC
jgi:hypothetical protein